MKRVRGEFSKIGLRLSLYLTGYHLFFQEMRFNFNNEQYNSYIQQEGQRLRLQPCETCSTVTVYYCMHALSLNRKKRNNVILTMQRDWKFSVRGATFRHRGEVTAVSPVHIFIRFIRSFF